MSGASTYHLAELAVVRDFNHPKRALPSGIGDGWTVLDVGCGIGQSLTAVEFSKCSSLHGIDVDADAIRIGKTMFPGLDLRVSPAELIPFPDATFDLTFSRVALPYTNIRIALREIGRVTKPGGCVWIALHPWAMERHEIAKALRTMNIRRIIDRGYVCANSLILAATGRCFPRPWSGLYETFQIGGRVAALMRSLRFANVSVSSGTHFIVSATRQDVLITTEQIDQ
jgi:ubiquinone/menaquinone biosynthesis C-methylase UbiE